MLNPYKYKEFNELIAKFMNLEKDEESGKWVSPINDSKIVNLKYQESWDWLMPVIEKLMSYETQDWYIHFGFEMPFCEILSHEDFPVTIFEYSPKENTLLLASYAKCIKLIEWINKNL